MYGGCMKKYVVGLTVFLFLLWHPISRKFVLFILPLGSGVDDVIAIVLGVIFVIVWKAIGERLNNA
jgi:hypothetical protein